MGVSDNTLSRYPFSGLLFDSLPLGIVFQDSAGIIVTANPAAERILGLSLDQMRGITSVDPRWRSVQEDGSPFPGEKLPAMVALQTGKAVLDTLMGVFNPKFDGHIWINVSAFPIKDEITGSINGVYALFEDVTVHHRTETVLSATQADLAEAQSVAQMGSWNWGINTGEDVFSEGLIRVFGRETIPPFEQQSGVIYSPETWRTLNDAVQETVRTGVGYNLDLPALRGDGTPIWINTRCQPVRNANGEIVGLRGTVQDITERKLLEFELADRERHFAALIATTPVGVFETDADGKCVFVNERWQQIAGMSLDAAKGDGWANAIHPEDRPMVYAEWTASTIERRLFRLEYRFQHPNSEVTWVLGQSSRFLSATGELAGYVGTITDITERKQAQKKLAFHSNILQSLSEGINLVRVSDGIIVFANPQFERMFGYESHELDGKHISIVNAPDERSAEAVAVEIGAALVKSGIWAGEVKNIRKDGTVFWCQASITSLDHDEFGPVWVSVHEDITKRKQAELWLASSKNRYQGILQNMMDAYWRVDEKGRIVEVNEAICQMHGYSEEEILQMSISDFELIESAEDTHKHIETIMREGRDAFESQHRCRDGRIIDLEISASLASDAPGNVDAFHRDITERKHAEAELIQHRDHLEELVAARTSELAQSRDAAEAGNRAKTIFLANMSHELRTPMNGVMGMIDLVLMRATDPKQIDWLNKSKGAAQRMVNVITDIIDFSKAEAERLPLEEKNFSLRQLVDDTLAMQGITVAAKGLNLTREFPVTMPDQLSGDVFRLRQILLNFLGNACKFSEQGTIAVRVSAVCQDGDSVLVRIEVEDQGIGISPEQQAVLFQAFTQADGSMTRKYGGSGLGLIISKRLANLMGGDVGVVSHEGRGSTFWATVRLKQAKACAVGN